MNFNYKEIKTRLKYCVRKAIRRFTGIVVNTILNAIWLVSSVQLIFRAEQHGSYYKYILPFYALQELKGDVLGQSYVFGVTLYYFFITSVVVIDSNALTGTIAALLFVVGILLITSHMIIIKTKFKSSLEPLIFALGVLIFIFMDEKGNWLGFNKELFLADFILLMIVPAALCQYFIMRKNRLKTISDY